MSTFVGPALSRLVAAAVLGSGDPLTLVAGILQVAFQRFVLFIAIGKVLRYVLMVWAWQHWSGF